MRRVLACLLLLGGCPFEDAELVDAGSQDDSDDDGIRNDADNCPAIANPTQRDHDLDFRGDACDLCPHIPTAIDTDVDADMVGDACDPRTFAGGDTFIAFYGFYSGDFIADWQLTDGWVIANGMLRWTNADASGVRAAPPLTGLTNVAITARVIGVSANPGVAQVGVVARRADNNFVRCSGSNIGAIAPHIESLVVENGTTFEVNAEWSGTLVGSFVLAHQVLGTAASCSIVPEGPAMVTNAPSRAGGIAIDVDGMAADVDFLHVVQMPAQ